MVKRIAKVRPQWIYFGTLFHNSQQALDATLRLLEHLPGAKRFYDVNLRDGNWNLTTVEQLASQATIIKLSDSEAESLDASLDDEGLEASVEHFCRRWSEQYRCKTICVTFGERGCGIYKEGQYTEAPGRKVEVADTIGAGDAFAAAFVHANEQGLGRVSLWRLRQLGGRTGSQSARRDAGVEYRRGHSEVGELPAEG